MSYDDETDRMRRRQTRQNRELNLITDTFRDDREYYAGFPKGSINQSGRETDRSRRKPGSRAAKSRGRAKHQTPVQTPARSRAQRRKRKILIILFETLILLSVLVFIGYSYLNQKMSLIQRLPWDPNEIKNVEISQEKQEQMKGYWTIAIFGVDSRNSSVGKGNNSDVNMLCNINMDTGEIKLVSVYRDAYMNVSDKNSYNKINAAYLNGGPEQAVKALNKNLDLDIDDYATFNWKAVADAINILDGVDVEITKTEFFYINAFITETVKATGIPSVPIKQPGMNHLDGVQAVAYGRLRLMDTDYARTERQRKIISLAFEKAKKADWGTLNNIIQTVFPQIATSVELTDILGMGRDMGKLHLGETSGFPSTKKEINLVKKGACVFPDTLESNVIELHKFLFDDEDYTPTETVRTISKKISSDMGQVKQGTKAASTATEKETKTHLEPSTYESEIYRPTRESSGHGRETAHSTEEWSTGDSRPDDPDSGWEEWETDPQGNPVESAGESNHSTKAETKTSVEESPDSPEGNSPKPESPTGQNGSGSVMAPGSNTSTGVILGPVNSTSESGSPVNEKPGGMGNSGNTSSNIPGGAGVSGEPGGSGSGQSPSGSERVEFVGPDGS